MSTTKEKRLKGFLPAVLLLCLLMDGLLMGGLSAGLSGCLQNSNQSDRAVLRVGEMAPDFSYLALGIQDKQDQSEKLSSLQGTVIYLDFWASWCGPCRESMPGLEQLYQELHDKGFVVLAVNLDQNVSEAQQFAEKLAVTYPLIRTDIDAIQRQYQVQGLPLAYMIDRDGKLRHVHVGFKQSDRDEIRQQILTLLDR